MTAIAVRIADRRFRDRARIVRSAEAAASSVEQAACRLAAHDARDARAAPLRARQAAEAALLARKSDTERSDRKARATTPAKKPA